MTDSGLVAAVDVGGTKIAAALVDAEGNILRKLKVPTDTGDRLLCPKPQSGAWTERPVPGLSILEQIAALVREVAGEAPISAVGMDVPGIYFAATGKVWAPNLPGWDHLPVRDILQPMLPAPLVVDSDRAACVLGEQWLGVAKGLDDVVFLAVGTGIGAGILSGGRLVRGAGDVAGSVGWFALDPRRKEIYRQVGCWEAEAAGPGLARRLGAPSAETVVEAARKGDPRALEALDETARYLGMGIANIVSIMNPQMIVLGGGLMQAGDLLLDRIRSEMLEWAQPVSASMVRIELTRLGEDAGLLGAAKIALSQTGR